MKRCLLLIAVAILFFTFVSGEGRCETETYAAAYVPWSGWWWPTSSGGLVTGEEYRGHPAPLEKYDYVMNGRCDGPATEFGSWRYYSEDAKSWHGMCFCWAAAAILEEEPVLAGIYDGTLFRVGDKKGLITVAYDGTLYTTVYDDAETDAPEVFHQVLDYYIREKRSPVIFDLGTGEEHWNFPVYKYDTDYTQNGNNIRRYTVKLYYASDGVGDNIDFVGTLVSFSTYYYWLEIEGETVTGSGWKNGSIPPKKAFEPFGTEPYINSIYSDDPGRDFHQEVNSINAVVGDPYEGNDTFGNAVSLHGGHYSLVAVTNDYFKVVDLEKGDKLYVGISSEHGASVSLKVYDDPAGDPVAVIERSGEQVIEAARTGDYYLEVVPWNPAMGPYYELTLRQSLAYQGIFPVDPGGLWATGITVLGSEDAKKIVVAQMDPDGQIKNSFDSSSKSHLVGVLERDFGVTSHYKGYLRIDSDGPVQGLQVVTTGGDLMFGSKLIPADSASSEVFFPHFIRGTFFGAEKTWFGLINIGNDDEEVERFAYDEEGILVGTDTISLAPGQKIEEDTLEVGILGGASSMKALATSGRDCLVGYIKFFRPSSPGDSSIPCGCALVPLPLERASALIVPHCACNDYWRTGIAVMNTGSEDTVATLTAYDADGYEIHVAQRMIRVNQNLVEEVADIFQSWDVAALKVESDNGQPLCGFVSYGSANGVQFSGVPLYGAAPAFTDLYLPHIACLGIWGTGIGILNTGDSAAYISFSLFDGDGNLLDETIRDVKKNQRISSLTKNLFDSGVPQSARYMKIKSTGPVNGMYLIATTDSRRLMGSGIGF